MSASARLVCRTWRSAFSQSRDSLRLNVRRPAGDAAGLGGALAFPRAHRVTLELPETPVADTQGQVDAWLHALQPRTAITHLALTSPTGELTWGPWSGTDPLECLRALRALASLQPLAELRHHLRSLSMDVSPPWVEAGCGVLAQFTLLTRLEVGPLSSRSAALGLAAVLRGGDGDGGGGSGGGGGGGSGAGGGGSGADSAGSDAAAGAGAGTGSGGGGLPHLRVLHITFGCDIEWGAAGVVDYQTERARSEPPLLAAAAGCPQLHTLVCRGYLILGGGWPDTAGLWGLVAGAFGPATMSRMDVTCITGGSSMYDSLLDIRSYTATGGGSTHHDVGATANTTAYSPAAAAGSGGRAAGVGSSTSFSLSLHVIAPADIAPGNLAACSGPGGATFSVAGAVMCDAANMLHLRGLNPMPTVRSVTYVVRHARAPPFLDLSALPPGLTSFSFRCREVADWLPISGAAPALTTLELAWEGQKADRAQCALQGAALAVLAEGCPSLTSLTLRCSLPAKGEGAGAAWAPLKQLRRLTHLWVSSSTPGQSHPPFCATWLPGSLECLRLSNVAVPVLPEAAGGPPPCLDRLLTLRMDHCRVADLRAFDSARSLRRLTAVGTPFAAGGDTLQSFSELEELWECGTQPLFASADPGVFVSVAVAAAAAAAGAAVEGGADTDPPLPRLRRLCLGVDVVGCRGVSVHLLSDQLRRLCLGGMERNQSAVLTLLQRLPQLCHLRLVAGGTGDALLAATPALASLPGVVSLEAAGPWNGGHHSCFARLQAALPSTAVVAAESLPELEGWAGGVAPAAEDIQGYFDMSWY